MKAQKPSGSKKSSHLAKAMSVAKKFAKSAIKGSSAKDHSHSSSSKDKKSHPGHKAAKPTGKDHSHHSTHHGIKGAKPAPKAQVAGKSADKAGMSHNGKKATAAVAHKVQVKTSAHEHKSVAGHVKKAAAPASKGKSGGAAFGASVSRKSLEVEAVCREVACEGLSTTGGYCRLHYIKNWKKIKRKELILKEGKLNQYIEELVIKYPDKYIEAIRLDLAGDKEFAKVIYDLDLDESVDDFDVDGDSADGLIDSIKRDFDDDSEGF